MHKSSGRGTQCAKADLPSCLLLRSTEMPPVPVQHCNGKSTCGHDDSTGTAVTGHSCEHFVACVITGDGGWCQFGAALRNHAVTQPADSQTANRCQFTVNENQPVVGIAVEVEECYLQCAKALIRSGLWSGAMAKHDSIVPSFVKMLIDQMGIYEETVELLNQQIEESYADRLY